MRALTTLATCGHVRPHTVQGHLEDGALSGSFWAVAHTKPRTRSPRLTHPQRAPPPHPSLPHAGAHARAHDASRCHVRPHTVQGHLEDGALSGSWLLLGGRTHKAAHARPKADPPPACPATRAPCRAHARAHGPGHVRPRAA